MGFEVRKAITFAFQDRDPSSIVDDFVLNCPFFGGPEIPAIARGTLRSTQDPEMEANNLGESRVDYELKVVVHGDEMTAGCLEDCLELIDITRLNMVGHEGPTGSSILAKLSLEILVGVYAQCWNCITCDNDSQQGKLEQLLGEGRCMHSFGQEVVRIIRRFLDNERHGLSLHPCWV